jgi:hypothetical protein
MQRKRNYFKIEIYNKHIVITLTNIIMTGAELQEMKEDELITLFIRTMEDNARSADQFETTYCLDHEGHGSFYGVNLRDLVFVAKNAYELWLIANDYMLTHTFTEHHEFDKTIVTGSGTFRHVISRNKHNKTTPYKMLEYDNLYDLISEMINERAENEDPDDISIVDLVDRVVEDFFNNMYFWAREVKYDLDEDDTDEDTEDDSSEEDIKIDDEEEQNEVDL